MRRFRYCLVVSATVITAVASVPTVTASAERTTDRASIDVSASHLEASLRQSAADRFGGLWIDSDGTVHVAVTANDARVAHLLASFPYQDRLRIATVAHTVAELQSVQHRVDADLAALKTAGALVTETFVDPRSDTLVVGLAPQSASSGADYVRAHYAGISLEITTDDYAHTANCVSRSTCAPEVEGGIDITDGNFLCTSGVVAGQGTNTKVLLTAGHCFSQGVQITDSNVPLGNVIQKQFSGSVDGEVIGITFQIPALYQWNPTPCEYTSAACGQNAFQGIAPSVGSNDCKSGHTTGYTCGQVTATGVTFNIKDDSGNVHTLTNQDQTNICALPGDSGGPNLDGGVSIEGMTSAGNFQVVHGQPICAAQPFSSFTPMPAVLQATGTYLPYNP